jgi:hypothetical protein
MRRHFWVIKRYAFCAGVALREWALRLNGNAAGTLRFPTDYCLARPSRDDFSHWTWRDLLHFV